MADFIPRPDGAFSAWLEQFAAQTPLFYEAHDLNKDDLLPMLDAAQAWRDAYAAHTAAQAAAEAARQAKDAARRAVEALARPVARYVQGLPFTTSADRALMALTVLGAAVPAPRAIESRPTARVLRAERFTHTLRLADESTPTRTARPKNARGAEVRRAVLAPGQPAPRDPESFPFLALATGGSLQSTFKPEDGGHTAFYVLRWIGPGGAVGPWSETVAATVAA